MLGGISLVHERPLFNADSARTACHTPLTQCVGWVPSARGSISE
jgi:hypothetical protein